MTSMTADDFADCSTVGAHTAPLQLRTLQPPLLAGFRGRTWSWRGRRDRRGVSSGWDTHLARTLEESLCQVVVYLSPVPRCFRERGTKHLFLAREDHLPDLLLHLGIVKILLPARILLNQL